MTWDAENYWKRANRTRLSRRNLIAASAAASAVGALAAACGTGRKSSSSGTGSGATQASGGQPQPGGTFQYSDISNPTLDPHTNGRYFTMKAVGGVMSRLLKYKTGADPKVADAHDIESDLALTVESPDAVTWTVKLRPDTKFHNVAPVNGRLVDSEDVKATFDRALNEPKNVNRASLDMIDLAQLQTPDKQTVVFKLKYPYAPFAHTLASPTYSWIFPREGTTGGYNVDKQVIGSGPFIFESFTPDVALVYKRNPDWYGKPQPYVDGVHHAIIPDTAAALAQFTSGHLDYLEPAPNDVDTLQKSVPQATVVAQSPGPGSWVFGQLGDPTSPWQDVRLRRAVSMAIDRDALGKTAWANKYVIQGMASRYLGKWALQVEDMPADLAQYFKYNPAESKKLLEASGQKDTQFKFVYTNNGYAPPFNQVAETINSMLNAAGIKTTLVTIDYQNQYVAGGKGYRYGNFPKDSLVSGLWVGPDDIDQIMFDYYHQKSTSKNTGLSDPTVSAMIDKARQVVNENDRVKAYLEVQKYLAEKMYLVVGLPYSPQYRAVQPRVQSYQNSDTYGLYTEAFAKLWLKG
jgi:peptide/nickel transport system substrate-binding protein